uniref:Amino acid permease n=1 Tax=Wuchereria bancrofti TaxID=6293 RepID=A0A1I8EXN2_WUCBA
MEKKKVVQVTERNSNITNSSKMGLCGAISYIISNIGAGLFITPTSVLEQVDSVGLSLIIWSVAALISLLGAFCYVELGTSIRRSGADFAYLCYVKYPIAFAFMCVGCFVVFPATLAIQAETFSEYLIKGFRIQIFEDTNKFYLKKLIGFSLLCKLHYFIHLNFSERLIGLLMMLNFFSLKIFVSRFQIVASLAKIITTAIIICTGFYFLIFKGETQNLQNIMEGTQVRPSHIRAALFAGLFSYDGWDVLNFGTEEIEKPKRTMPLAIIVGMSLVAFIFLATNISFFVVLGIDQMKSSVAVADTFATAKLDKFYSVLPFLICILLIGSMNTSLFCASRYLLVAARQGHLPAFLSCSNTEHNSPRVAIFISVMTTVIADTHMCSIGGSVALGGLVFYFLFFYTHSPSAIKGIKTFGCNANSKLTYHSLVVISKISKQLYTESFSTALECEN